MELLVTFPCLAILKFLPSSIFLTILEMDPLQKLVEYVALAKELANKRKTSDKVLNGYF